MATCKYIFFILLTFFCINSSSVLAEFNKIKKVDITTMDFLLTRFDNFFIKNQHKILGNNPLAVRYESINYNVIYEVEKSIQIFLEAKMDRYRYKSKKYFPKLVDCNIIRNRIFFNKFGYSGITRKINYSLSESGMREVIKKTIYNLENLNEPLKNFLIDKTKINVEIIHPIKTKNISCSGNLTDIELR